MGTHCIIAFENEDTSVSWAYCHYDGYLAGVGRQVVTMSREQALSHVEDGDMRCIGEPFRDSDDCAPKRVSSVAGLKAAANGCGGEFIYVIRRDGTWEYMTYNDVAFHPLASALAAV